MSKILYTGGTFDVFHYGHMNFLRQCSKIADRVVVSLNTDEFIEYYKGKGLISDVYLGPNEKGYIKYFSKKKLACNIHYNLSLIDLARKLYLNRIVISNDCGPMHIAGVLGVPLLGIFNETLPACWFPYKRKGQIPLGGNTKIIFNNKLINKDWPTLRTVIKKANRELCI